ncbi:hypothetical protein BDQ17DRAFT_1050667 [Cyathus striatus]|nr:hypothetical protein BDQ17DRAFT_1050667 [Cyathus striatus]
MSPEHKTVRSHLKCLQCQLNEHSWTPVKREVIDLVRLLDLLVHVPLPPPPMLALAPPLHRPNQNQNQNQSQSLSPAHAHKYPLALPPKPKLKPTPTPPSTTRTSPPSPSAPNKTKTNANRHPSTTCTKPPSPSPSPLHTRPKIPPPINGMDKHTMFEFVDPISFTVWSPHLHKPHFWAMIGDDTATNSNGPTHFRIEFVLDTLHSVVGSDTEFVAIPASTQVPKSVSFKAPHPILVTCDSRKW